MSNFLHYNCGITWVLAIIITKKRVGVGTSKQTDLHGLVVVGDAKEAILIDFACKKILYIEVEKLYEDIIA